MGRGQPVFASVRPVPRRRRERPASRFVLRQPGNAQEHVVREVLSADDGRASFASERLGEPGGDDRGLARSWSPAQLRVRVHGDVPSAREGDAISRERRAS